MSPARRRVLPALLVFVLAAAFGPRQAIAKDTEKSWEFGAYALSSKFAGGSKIDNGFGWGVRGGYHLKALQEFEGSFDSVSSSNSKVSGINYDVTNFAADFLRMYFIKGHEKMIPFAKFGLGVLGIDDGSDSLTSTTIRFGGGFKYFIKPRGGIRFDLTAYHWHGDGVLVNRDPFFTVDFTLGATFLIGGAQ